MKSPRESAFDIALEFEQTRPRLDQLFANHLSTSPAEPRDRSFIRHLVSGTTRHLLYLDWLIARLYDGKFKKMLSKTKVILRLALYEIRFMDRIPARATVNEYVKLARKKTGQRAAGLVNGLLRSYLRNPDQWDPSEQISDELERISVIHSFPLWLVKRWAGQWGVAETDRLCAALNTPPEFDLTIHQDRISAEEFKKRLDQAGIEWQPSPYFENVISVHTMQPIIAGGWLDQGLCSVQDESAVIPVRWLNPQKEDWVLDVCAAPGGKYLQILERRPKMAVAMDVDLSRLKQVKNNVERRGLRGAHFVCADGQHLPFKPVFSKILLDAPCSGLGVIRKHPDIKWRRSLQEIAGFSALQQAILTAASRVVRPGGLLSYGTCTLDALENETVAAVFEQAHAGEFERQPIPDELKQFEIGGRVQTFPHRQGTDGSFCALYQKSSAFT